MTGSAGRPAAHVLLASHDTDFVRLLREQLRAAGLTVSVTRLRGQQLRRMAALRAAQVVVLDADGASRRPDGENGPPTDVAVAAVGAYGDAIGAVRFIGKWSPAPVLIAAVSATLAAAPADVCHPDPVVTLRLVQ